MLSRYDTSDPRLTERQRQRLSFPPAWLNTKGTPGGQPPTRGEHSPWHTTPTNALGLPAAPGQPPAAARQAAAL